MKDIINNIGDVLRSKLSMFFKILFLYVMIVLIYTQLLNLSIGLTITVLTILTTVLYLYYMALKGRQLIDSISYSELE